VPYIKKEKLEELENEEKKREKKEDIKLRVIYYVDELSILLISVISVILSDAITKRARGKLATVGDLALDWLNLLISALLALLSYGMFNTKFKYNDNKKPPYYKRLSNSILNGIAWRAIIGYTE
jgi:hypothetical protein